MDQKHCWPNKNNYHRYQGVTLIDYITEPPLRWSLLGLLLPLIVLFLFALSQAGTSLFLLTKFGFSHPVALLFASMVCTCLTSVYFQKISLQFKKTFFYTKTFYKAYKDLHRSFASVEFGEKLELKQMQKVQAMWLLLQHRHLVKNLRLKLKQGENVDVKSFLDTQLEKTMRDLGGAYFKIELIDQTSFLYSWSFEVLSLEKFYSNLVMDEEDPSGEKISQIRSKLATYRWACLEGFGDNKELKSKTIEELNGILNTDRNQNNISWHSVLQAIKESEDLFCEGVEKIESNQADSWLKKFKHQRINIDHKRNPDPKLYGFAMYSSWFGGLGNMMAGNNLIGLYGSVAGVGALISFYPILHLSAFVKIVIAIFGCCSAAYASYALTWPMLHKLLKQVTRWRMRQNFRRYINKPSFEWLTKRSIDWRICICVLFAGFVTLSAVNFNVYATWHLTNRLIALFPDTVFAKFLAHMPIVLKVFLSGLQALISFLCAGALYFTSCFNQYVGQPGKVNLRFISVLDKIHNQIKQKSWLKVIQLIVIVIFSGLAAIAQTIIWFHGINPVLLYLCSIPASLAFFATFCEAALACLDNEDANVWLNDTQLNAWLKYQAPPISSSSSTLSQDNDKGQYNLSLSTIGDEDEDEDRIDVTSSLDDPIGLDLSGDGIPEFRDNVNS